MKRKNRFICICLLLVGLLLILPNTQFHTVKTESGTSKNLVSFTSSSPLTDIERIDYRNEQGQVTFAEDRHYASLVYTRDEKGQIMLEQYFNEKGEPVAQPAGHVAIAREYNELGQNDKVIYLDDQGDPVMITSGYAIIHRSFNPDGQIEIESYYDDQERPVVLSQGQSAVRYSAYDNMGRPVRIDYLDENGQLMYLTAGYVGILKSYDEKGKLYEQRYLDEEGYPTDSAYGEYGVRYEDYNEFGDACKLTYLDKDGKPMITDYGYATVVRTFADDRSVLTERYYDIQGNPANVGNGRYGVLHSDNNVTSLDIEGKPMFLIEEFLHQHIRLVVVCVVIFLLLLNKSNHRWEDYILLAISIAMILYMTLLTRESTIQSAQMELLWSYRQFFTAENMRNEIINNILLFIPFGACIKKIYPKKRILLLALLFSACIEITQYLGAYGLCELDDVLSNSLGGVIGYYMQKILEG